MLGRSVEKCVEVQGRCGKRCERCGKVISNVWESVLGCRKSKEKVGGCLEALEEV